MTTRSVVLRLLSFSVASHASGAQSVQLAPLGKAAQSIYLRGSASERRERRLGQGKKLDLDVTQIAAILKDDIAIKEYFITGNLTEAIFAEECCFSDPTNTVTGLNRYLNALDILFDPSESSVKLIDINVLDSNHIQAKWILGGVLKLPWRPLIKPYEGTCIYTLDEDMLIVAQDQTWSISAGEALKDTFTPGKMFDGPSVF